MATADSVVHSAFKLTDDGLMEKFLVVMDSMDQSEQQVHAYVRARHQVEAGEVALSMLRDQFKTTDEDILRRYRVATVTREYDGE